MNDGLVLINFNIIDATRGDIIFLTIVKLFNNFKNSLYEVYRHNYYVTNILKMFNYFNYSNLRNSLYVYNNSLLFIIKRHVRHINNNNNKIIKEYCLYILKLLIGAVFKLIYDDNNY